MLESFFTNAGLTEEQFWYSLVPLMGVFGIGLTLFAVFSIRVAVRGLPRTARIVAQGGTPFLGHFTMEYFYWMIGPITRWMVRHKVSPNTLTTLSLVTGIGAAIPLAFGWFGLGGWMILLSATFDVFDGMVARARGMASESGDYWDSVADRICDSAAFFGFAVYYSDNLALFSVVIVAMVASFMVSYARAKAEAYGAQSHGGVMQRHERVVYLGLGAAASPIVALINEPGDPKPEYWLAVAGITLVAFFSTYTAIRRMHSAFANIKARESRGEPPRGPQH